MGKTAKSKEKKEKKERKSKNKKKEKKTKCLQTIAAIEKQANGGNLNACDLDLVRIEESDLGLLIDTMHDWKERVGKGGLRIRHLNFHTVTEVDDEKIDSLIRAIGSPDLRSVCLSIHAVGSKSIRSLAKMLRKCEKLRHLDLAHNSLGPAGISELSAGRAFQFDEQSEGLRHLDLFFNLLGNKGTACLAQMLAGGHHSSLHVLKLDFNNIGE
jgi:hypothetical protein